MFKKHILSTLTVSSILALSASGVLAQHEQDTGGAMQTQEQTQPMQGQTQDPSASQQVQREPQSQQQKKMSQTDMAKAQNRLIGAYLQASQNFTKSLEQQIDGDVQLTNKEVKQNVETYLKESKQNLKGAQTQLSQLQKMMQRNPASVQQNNFQSLQQSVQQAMNTGDQIEKNLNKWVSTPEQFKQQVSKWQQQISTALEKQSDLVQG